LRREPDAGGLAHYRERLQAGVGVTELVDEFLGSVEFVRMHAEHRAGAQAGARPSARVNTAEGFSIFVDPSDFAVGHTIALDARYEPEVTATVRHLLRPGQTFVDAGANIGWFSLLAASLVGPSGRVIAIEPNPLNVALLRTSAKDNGFDNIDAVAVALGESTGAVALETDGSNGRVIPVAGPPDRPVAASFVVASQPLDSVLAEAGAGRVDAIKMDVEGAEPMVLRGAAATIERDRPVIVSEFYPLALESSPWGSAGGYLRQLRDGGYRLSVIGAGTDLGDAAIMGLARDAAGGHVDLLAEPG